ncbi:cilia- and flagella-associated protein 418 isoform X5 [Eleutherodactylus coqui]|uniref:cilia- and flagella-associated protein 418 isoform X5 n=1 Tax=Eleutherodactylus coqui TaxID=57060 RepID=UPI003463253C
MADDGLDQLLDEVESKYCQPGTGSRAEGKRCGGHDGRRGSKHPVKIASADDENVDDLIDDILDVRLHEESKTQNGKSTSQQSCKTSGQHPSKKCCPVYLGGSLIPFGIGTSVSERNSMPEHSKLQTKMVRKKGSRVYACQCSWRSVQQLTDLSAEQPLCWVCGKHSG